MRRAIVFLVRIYRWSVGLVLPNSCRFRPTCSEYAIEAITIHGIIRGGILSLWRIVRCNPWCQGGWDPVPSKNNRRRKTEKVNRS